MLLQQNVCNLIVEIGNEFSKTKNFSKNAKVDLDKIVQTKLTEVSRNQRARQKRNIQVSEILR